MSTPRLSNDSGLAYGISSPSNDLASAINRDAMRALSETERQAVVQEALSAATPVHTEYVMIGGRINTQPAAECGSGGCGGCDGCKVKDLVKKDGLDLVTNAKRDAGAVAEMHSALEKLGLATPSVSAEANPSAYLNSLLAGISSTSSTAMIEVRGLSAKEVVAISEPRITDRRPENSASNQRGAARSIGSDATRNVPRDVNDKLVGRLAESSTLSRHATLNNGRETNPVGSARGNHDCNRGVVRSDGRVGGIGTSKPAYAEVNRASPANSVTAEGRMLSGSKSIQVSNDLNRGPAPSTSSRQNLGEARSGPTTKSSVNLTIPSERKTPQTVERASVTVASNRGVSRGTQVTRQVTVTKLQASISRATGAELKGSRAAVSPTVKALNLIALVKDLKRTSPALKSALDANAKQILGLRAALKMAKDQPAIYRELRKTLSQTLKRTAALLQKAARVNTGLIQRMSRENRLRVRPPHLRAARKATSDKTKVSSRSVERRAQSKFRISDKVNSALLVAKSAMRNVGVRLKLLISPKRTASKPSLKLSDTSVDKMNVLRTKQAHRAKSYKLGMEHQSLVIIRPKRIKGRNAERSQLVRKLQLKRRKRRFDFEEDLLLVGDSHDTIGIGRETQEVGNDKRGERRVQTESNAIPLDERIQKMFVSAGNEGPRTSLVTELVKEDDSSRSLPN